jgi:hypothetical protein
MQHQIVRPTVEDTVTPSRRVNCQHQAEGTYRSGVLFSIKAAFCDKQQQQGPFSAVAQTQDGLNTRSPAATLQTYSYASCNLWSKVVL